MSSTMVSDQDMLGNIVNFDLSSASVVQSEDEHESALAATEVKLVLGSGLRNSQNGYQIEEYIRRMLRALEKYPYVWQVPPGKRGPGKSNTTEWQNITQHAVRAFGRSDNYEVTNEEVKMTKVLFGRVKKSLKHRIDQAVIKGNISHDSLTKDSVSALNEMYDKHSWEYWRDVEYLTKYLIYHQPGLEVDIDGVFSLPEEEQDEQSQRRNQQFPYHEVLSGVSGFQPQVSYRQLPRIERRRTVSETRETHQNYEGGNIITTLPTANTTAKDGTAGQSTAGAQGQQNSDENLSLPVAQVKLEQEEYLEEDDDMDQQIEPPENEHRHGVAAYEALVKSFVSNNPDHSSTIRCIKQERQDDAQESMRCRNPLQHLLPQNVTGPNVRKFPAECFGITPEEMAKRSQVFQNFQQSFTECVQGKSEQEVWKVIQLCLDAINLTATLADGNCSPDQIAEEVKRKCKL